MKTIYCCHAQGVKSALRTSVPSEMTTRNKLQKPWKACQKQPEIGGKILIHQTDGSRGAKKTLWKFMFAIFTKITDIICIKNTKMWSGNVISLHRMKRVNFSPRVDFLLAPFSLLRGLLSQWWKGLSTLLSSELPTRSLLTGHKCTSYIHGPLFNWTNQ